MLRLSNICALTDATCRRNFALNPSNKHKKENYYEILQVNRNCSSRDIRNAFVKLSKKYHPDVTGVGTHSAARFVQISEAYQTLIKPKARKEYDHLLQMHGGYGARRPYEEGSLHRGEVFRSWEIKPEYNPNPGPYYGVKGYKRVSNLRVALVMATIGIISALVGFAAVRYSFALHRQKLDDISVEANTHHEAVTADARKYGNEEQIRRMLERMRKEDT